MTTPAEDLFLAMIRSGQLDRARIESLVRGEGAEPALTHEEFFPTAVAAAPEASARTYKTGFRRLVARFGTTPISTVQVKDLDSMCVSLLKQTRASGRSDGTGAVRGFISAARFWYALAVKHGYRSDNPARLLTMPARRRRVRRALTEEELRDLYRVVGGTGNDPVLDLLLLDFHRETAARMGGALTLRVCDVNPARGSVLLREKYGHEREIPLSPALIDQCLTHAEQRAVASNSDTLFRYRSGAPLTRRRYNSIFKRVQTELAWAGRLGVSVHWLRHTTLTDVSNAAGSRIAAAYAGHSDRTVTDLYTVPTFEDLQEAHRMIFMTSPHLYA